jgi:uncharacterized Zn-binding protein involved in type VI secretion
MSNYTKSTNFATKDGLTTGDPLKIIKGTEIDDEFEAIETHMSTKADGLNAVLTGTATVNAATITTGTVTTLTSTTANITTVDLGNWTITEDSGNLIFAYGGTNKFQLTSSGAMTVADDVTAFGTP